VRAERRFRELAAASPAVARDKAARDEVAARMQARDERDTTREVAPLRPAADARTVDTTDMGLDEVVAAMLAHIQERLADLTAGA
jgi:cytidylate kinase